MGRHQLDSVSPKEELVTRSAVDAEWIDWGVVDYSDAHQRQLDRVEERKRDEVLDAIITVSHPHVITVGRRKDSADNVLASGDVPVVTVERGGDVTYHGPGQIVGYPILALLEGERDLHALLRNLEQAMIETCAHFGLHAGRESGKTGVWIDGRKLASIGVACRRWVTFHGIALNVDTDLLYFQRINPCGFVAVVLTCMKEELGHDLEISAVRNQLVTDLAHQLSRGLVSSSS